MEVATFGMGCFWCSESIFGRLVGVESVRYGYMGGHQPAPTYNAVCSGITGHAEVVEVAFNYSKITYSDLLRVFFHVHDPTTPNRQGPDVGSQYRSVIFFHNEEQAKEARGTIAHLSALGIYSSPIITEVLPAEVFYPAEEYHADYFARHSREPYCRFVIAPKVIQFEKEFSELLRDRVE